MNRLHPWKPKCRTLRSMCRKRTGLMAWAVGMALLLLATPGIGQAEEKPKKEKADVKADAKTDAKADAKTDAKADIKTKTKPKADPFAWKSMFDGKTLKGWKVPNFGGQGEVHVEDGAVVMEMGNPMTGITWTGKPLKTNYELQLEGKRTLGNDFFCTTTFPVGDAPCSFVVGGWGGTVVGLSCVDWYDASDNFTTNFVALDDNKWYKIRIRVTDARIECWIDDDQSVDLQREGHKFSIRDEVDLCVPLGVCSYQTEGRLRNIRVRPLKPEEIKAAAEKK